MHGLDVQHQDVNRTSRGKSISDKWRNYVHGVANLWIEDSAEQCIHIRPVAAYCLWSTVPRICCRSSGVIIRELYELNCIRVSLMQLLPMMLYWLRRLVIASFCWRLSLVAHGTCANYTRMRWPLLARLLNRTFSSLSRAV